MTDKRKARQMSAYAAALPHVRAALRAYAEAMRPRRRDSDGSPEGEKPQALSAEHDSAGLKGIAIPSTPPPSSKVSPNV